MKRREQQAEQREQDLLERSFVRVGIVVVKRNAAKDSSGSGIGIAGDVSAAYGTGERGKENKVQKKARSICRGKVGESWSSDAGALGDASSDSKPSYIVGQKISYAELLRRGQVLVASKLSIESREFLSVVSECGSGNTVAEATQRLSMSCLKFLPVVQNACADDSLLGQKFELHIISDFV